MSNLAMRSLTGKLEERCNFDDDSNWTWWEINGMRLDSIIGDFENKKVRITIEEIE